MGTKPFRNDAESKVRGTGIFAADLTAPNMLFGVPVFSSYVAATNLRVHTEDAEQLAGMHAVLTAKDVPGILGGGPIKKDIPIFADTCVRSWGDVIALVVAESREIALAAAELVTEEATPVEPILSVAQALGGFISEAATTNNNAREVYPEMAPKNIVNHHHLQHGSHQNPLDNADHIIEAHFSAQMVEHAYMEPEAVLCVPRYDGVYEVYGSIQHLFSIQRLMAGYLSLPLADIEVHTVLTGGSFGGKDENMGAICARAGLAAMKTRRPISLVYTREWSLRESYKRHPYEMDYAWGFDKEGRFTGAKVELYAESGPYTSVTPWVTWRSIAQCCGPYVVPNVRGDSWGVATNRCYTGAMRGFGSPQINFAIEQMMDISAQRLGISPVEIRRRNMVKQGSETITGQILDNHTVSLESVMDAVLTEIDFEEKYAHCSFGGRSDRSLRGSPVTAGSQGHATGQAHGGSPENAGSMALSDPDTLYGIGFALSYRGSSIGAEGFDFSAATINALFDGSILLETGIQENGQGAESAMLLVAAEELGVSLSRLRYRRSRTSTVPDSGNTVASRGTLMGTSAVVAATNKLKRLMAQHLAPMLGSHPEEVRFHDDQVWGRGDSCAIPWEEAMAMLLRKQVHPQVTATYQAPEVSWIEETGQGKAYFTYVYSCQAVELEVSKKTGKIKLTNIVAGHDIGRAINKEMLEAQIHGGIAQAIGYALSEEVTYNEEGVMTSLNLNKYKIPRISEIPPIKVLIVENSDPNSLSGAKGIGEPATELLAPAIANAVYNATGKRHYSLPITIDPKELV